MTTADMSNPSHRPAMDVPRFNEIEGLRGWLAWMVVVGHVANYTAQNLPGRLFSPIAHLPSAAVTIFVCISGFVIAHLILVKSEPYSVYLTRRFFRIFPCFAVACVLGGLTSFLAVEAIPLMPWANVAGFEYPDESRATLQSQLLYFPYHLLLHATMLHGVVPAAALPFAERVMLPPGWSLTLEWQFYLVAPFVIPLFVGMRRTVVGALLTLLTIALWYGWLAHYYRLPAFLPAKFYCFAVGITCRTYFPLIRHLLHNSVLLVGAIFGCVVLMAIVPPIATWLLFVIYLAAISGQRPTPGGMATAKGVLRATFTGRLAMHSGALSFAVYALHWPAMELAGYTVLRLWPVDGLWATAIIGAATLALTYVAALAVHHAIERPGMRVGAWLAARRAKAIAPAPPARPLHTHG